MSYCQQQLMPGQDFKNKESFEIFWHNDLDIYRNFTPSSNSSWANPREAKRQQEKS